ncbi:TetR/AcrR family transcriptional regulator [Variovorax sp. J22R133]|uniref:TetR/AcrR family transcriptional regulator n=1 Tax=Variovorax brevis TaxID=3053503 RepID=UPI0025777E29|nr:TetR/AcrR family transcriptional regulator [Variovorax sp. J22R133]MDM0114103.1 TetR/AcrR family transcriptional regulator [Variovorax sp. J22R133]
MKPKANRSPSPAAPRRKPRQSRAHHTSRALQEAFVRLLVERGYAGITIREIVSVAGTGLGSFYEYFAGKEDLARVCLHLRSKALLMDTRNAALARAGRPLQEIADAIIDAQVAAHSLHPQEWGAHYLLERHLSSSDAYRKMYERFVDEWAAAFATASDALPDALSHEAARVSHAVLYGVVSHTFIHAGGVPDMQAMAQFARRTVWAYLKGIRLSPAA